MADRNQRSLKAKQTLDRRLAALKESTAASEKEEIDRIRREEQSATKNLLAIKQEYPRSPEVAQRSYQAGKQLEEIERQYQGRYADVRNRSETALREQQSDLNKAYQAEIAAIESGSEPARSIPEIRRAVPVTRSTPLPDSSPEPPQEVGQAEATYFVSGLAKGDTLSVRSGPGVSYEVVARLPNGYQGIRTIGAPVMNGTTEWVQINSETYKGWVTRIYLQTK